MSPLVRAGEPIAVVAPCGPFPAERFATGVGIAEAAGHALDVPDDILRPWRYLAGDDDHRLAGLQRALRSEEHAAIWLARGGYGLTRLLPRLDLDGAVPKPVIGFSDCTALFACLWRAGWPGPLVHGPVVNSLPISDDATREALWATLAGAGGTYPGSTWRDGVAEGPVLGGNLALLAALCGTPWQLDVRGAILVIEDVGEAPYRLDRMLQQLVSAGGLDGVAGVCFGDFADCRPPAGATWTLREVLLDGLRDLRVPILGDVPVGHGPRNHAFVWGRPGRIADGALEIAR